MQLIGPQCEIIRMPASAMQGTIHLQGPAKGGSTAKLDSPPAGGKGGSRGSMMTAVRGSTMARGSMMNRGSMFARHTHMSTIDDDEEPSYRLSIEVKSARGLKDGDAKVYARVKCSGHKMFKHYTPKVRRQFSASGVEVSSFMQVEPFILQVYDINVSDEDEIEVYIWEDVLGPDVPLGHAEVSLSSLKGFTEKQGRWYELRKNGKLAGQVYLSLFLAPQSSEPSSVGGGVDLAKSAKDPEAASEEELEEDYFKLSGGWRGFFWQPKGLEDQGEAMQASEMEMVFSPGDGLNPYQLLSGTGSDALGSYELRAGRRFTQTRPYKVEWVKTYTAMNRAYASIDKHKLEQANAKVKSNEEPISAQNFESVPEIFCEGHMDPSTGVISGSWHMNFRLEARCHKVPRWEGDEKPEEVRCGQRAYPAPIAEKMLEIRQPELWDQREEVMRLVAEKKKMRGGGGPKQLTASEMEWVVRQDTLSGFLTAGEKKRGGKEVRQAVRYAMKLVQEVELSVAKLELEPKDIEDSKGWTHFQVKAPAELVSGSFVLFQKGLPPHMVYDALANKMPKVDLADLVAKEARVKAGAMVPRPLGEVPRQRCLIIEFGKLEGMGNFATKPGVDPNLYLVAEIGKQSLICQPILASQRLDGKLNEEEKWDERFLVFYEGGAEGAAEDGELNLTVTLKNKNVGSGDLYAANASSGSIGGPPFFGSGLAAQLDSEVKKHLKSCVAKAVKAHEAKVAKAEKAKQEKEDDVFGMIGGFMGAMSDVVTALVGEEEEVTVLGPLAKGIDAKGKQPPAAPKDEELGVGKLDVSKDMRMLELPREAEIDIEVRMQTILASRGIPGTLKNKVKAFADKAIEAYGVTDYAAFAEKLGFDSIEELIKSFEVPIGELLAGAKLQESALPVGKLHVRIAAIEWHEQMTSASAAALKPAQSSAGSSIASMFSAAPSSKASNGGGSARNIFANFDDTHGSNPYDVRVGGRFVQYAWEANEHFEIKKKLDSLTKAYDSEVEQQKALDVLAQRVEGRRLELRYATKRQRELQMLEGLSDFVTSHYERSSVLKENARNRLAKAEQSAMVWSSPQGTMSVLKMLLKASIAEEDVESLKLIKEIFARQLEVLNVWQDGFTLAESAGKEEEVRGRRQATRKGTPCPVTAHTLAHLPTPLQPPKNGILARFTICSYRGPSCSIVNRPRPRTSRRACPPLRISGRPARPSGPSSARRSASSLRSRRRPTPRRITCTTGCCAVTTLRWACCAPSTRRCARCCPSTTATAAWSLSSRLDTFSTSGA